MLQRAGIRPPSPLKSYPNDTTIFNKDGKLKDQYHKLCQEINISPEELYPRDIESFRESNTTRNVQILRYNNFENKRRAKIEALRAVVKQRGNVPATKPARPGTTSPRSRALSFPNNPESMSNVDKDSHRVPRPPTRDYGSNLHTKNSTEGHLGARHKGSFDMSPMLSTGLAYKHSPGSREASVEKMKKVDNSYVVDGDECYYVEEQEEKLMRYIKQKEKQKERMVNASTIVTRKEEEYREEIKRAYESKLEKWNKNQEKKEALHKKKKQDNDEEEYRKEKIENLREQQKENQKALYEKVLNKLEKSERQKRMELEKRVNKLVRLNTTFQERYFSCMEKKEAESSVYMEESLLDIENKCMATGFRKRKFIEEKKIEASKHLIGMDERLQKVKDGREEESKGKLGRLIWKMEKERCKSAIAKKKKPEKEPRPIEQNTEYMERMEERSIRENDLEKQKLENLKEKQKKIEIKLERRKTNMSELIAERRELWNQKLENINENKEIANEASEKYLEQRMRSYKEKVDNIQRMKEERKRLLAKLNRTFA